MIVTFSIWKPPGLPDGIYYLINVDKGDGLQCQFVAEIVKLPEEYHALFYDQYDEEVVENEFLTANFLDFSRFGITPRYTPISKMRFTRRELKQFVEEGLAESVFDFIATQAFRAIVVIPTHPVLSKMYDEVLSENEQEIGYHYNRSYVEEQNIHVIEP